MDKRFERNIPAISLEEQEIISKKHVLVVGCGGLGGHIIENLVRLGFGKITAADNDTFDISNLNRQLLATDDLVGTKKAFAAKARAEAINPSISFNMWTMKVTEKTVSSALAGKDLVIDALDTVEDRLMLEKACEKAGLPLIHGAVVNWQAQVMTVMPGSNCLTDFYANNSASSSNSVLSFTVAFCAAIQAAEALKVLCGMKSDYENKILIADLKTASFNVYDPSEKIFTTKTFTVKVNTFGKAANEVKIAEGTTLQELADKVNIHTDNATVNGNVVKFVDYARTYLSEDDQVTFIDYNSFARGG